MRATYEPMNGANNTAPRKPGFFERMSDIITRTQRQAIAAPLQMAEGAFVPDENRLKKCIQEIVKHLLIVLAIILVNAIISPFWLCLTAIIAGVCLGFRDETHESWLAKTEDFFNVIAQHSVNPIFDFFQPEPPTAQTGLGNR